MGFISYSLDYYQKCIREFEQTPATSEKIYLARQLLKMLDDLKDEGYTYLSEQLEAQFSGVQRLQAYLAARHAEPFPILPRLAAESQLDYGPTQVELEAFLDDLMQRARPGEKSFPFIGELERFTQWLGKEAETAYIFLLRDTLLPCLAMKKAGFSCHPWLLGRKMVGHITGEPYADDEIRAVLIKALEAGIDGDFAAFRAYCTPRILQVTEKYPALRETLLPLLSAIPQRKILVVESGCYGTFPMLLAALDERVEVAMYTTVPFMKTLYGPRIFTPAYENNRLFETLYAQDLYFRFADFRDGHFFVEKCTHPQVEQHALNEIGQMLAGNGD